VKQAYIKFHFDPSDGFVADGSHVISTQDVILRHKEECAQS